MRLTGTSSDDVEKVYHAEIFQNREQAMLRPKYEKEKALNALIVEGNVEKLAEKLDNIKEKTYGRMSHNSFRQQLYAIIIGIAVATRAALEGGMEEEEAYTLSDIYIQKADRCNSVEELWKLYVKAMLDFAERVAKSKNKEEDTISSVIQLAVDYILRNLHYNVSLKDIADTVGLSETYFSTLFKKEIGCNVSEFIQKNRIKEAKSLLRYSEYSLIEISQYLGFCSQSHFAQTFRKYEKVTPGQYRKNNFKSSW
ncbi:MAG: helix-turn-helix domain-containing protein [Cellulosilyticaceae bacterium]